MWNNFRRCFYLLLSVLFFYQLVRLLFFIVNHSYFPHIREENKAGLILHSLRFDLSVALTWLLPFLFVSLLPFRLTLLRKIIIAYFYLIGTISFLFEISDIAYYPFVRKRMTADVLHLLGEKADFFNLLPSYLSKFWFVPVLIILFLSSFYFLTHKILKRFPTSSERYQVKEWILYGLLFLCTFLGIRGSIGLKPIMPNSALMITSAENAALVYNTTFSLIHSLEDQKLTPIQFMSDREAGSIYSTLRNYSTTEGEHKENVVVIILESFGKMYTGLGGRKSYTPFLDQLCSQGFVCTKAFANASTSATGIPSILAGIPNFYNEAFTTSPYGRNRLDALGVLLKQEGYATSFYHGGTNGTMNFNIFAATAGFDKYVGRNEYPNPKDYDGTWGISDLPFLSFYADELNKEKQPFLSTIFTLSSHEPFSLPVLGLPFIDTLNGIQKGIRYTDYALEQFFKKISKEKWYKHTLFVITADHNYMAGYDEMNYYNHGLGMFAIPILYFHSDNSGSEQIKGVFSDYTQQMDILPSILDYLHYPKPFLAFGYSVFRNEPHFAYNHLNETNLYVSRDTLIDGRQDRIVDMFDMRKDSSMSIHLPIVKTGITNHYKAFLQTLHHCIVSDSMKYVGPAKP